MYFLDSYYVPGTVIAGGGVLPPCSPQLCSLMGNGFREQACSRDGNSSVSPYTGYAVKPVIINGKKIP